jgi:osmotically inducible protein OsmC
MAGVDRTASVTWEGTLTKGAGRFSAGSGALGENEVTWASRTARSEGKTSPEELIAAALGTCFSMSLAHILEQAGTPPERLSVEAMCRAEILESGPKITKAHLDVSGRADGMDQAGLEQAVAAAAEGCPVSGALKGNVEITHEAEVES